MKPSRLHKPSGRSACIALAAAISLAGCDVVLGIDEVSSAEGPDGGRRISASTIDPAFRDARPARDAAGDHDASAEVDAGAEDGR